jgi:multidrug efflux system outer membrane protein
MAWKRWLAGGIVYCVLGPFSLHAQNATESAASATPVMLTLKRSLELALQNSKDIQVARIRARVAEQSANLTKAEFLPNLYAGSGAGYTYGLPETPGGRPPSIFSVTYTEEVFNGPLRGLAREQEEQAKAQRLMLQDTRVSVMEQVTLAYLELVKVRHALELLRKEKDSAEKIVEVTQERQNEGYELPTEVTRAQLTKAQVVQRILQLEGRQDELEVYLRNQLGLASDQPIDVTSEELPGAAEQAGANLVALAEQGNTNLAFAQSDVKAKEFRLAGEKKGYWPTLQLVSIYDVLAKYNFQNYNNLVNSSSFRYNNLNAGVNVNVPIFSAKTKASVQLAQADLDAAKLNLASKKSQVSAEVRQRSRKLQEADAAKEVARLELQLAQQSLAVLQSQFGEGKANLRDVEKARLQENDKWMNYLDANFQRQQAQLDLLRIAGQLEKVLE